MKDTQVDTNVRIIASEAVWIESQAVQQLKSTAALPNILSAVGLPDLHPGHKYPVGAVFAAKHRVYPALAGSDIGCGMSLYQTTIANRKVKLDKFVKKMMGFEELVLDKNHVIQEYELEQSKDNDQLGTIGGGNHFAELQTVDTVYCQQSFDNLAFKQDLCFLLVHSGSRKLGHTIFQDCVQADLNSFDMLKPNESALCEQYMEQHNYAIRWARANRDCIADKVFSLLKCDGLKHLDICHNSIELEDWGHERAWVHRKGASSARLGPVVIPGSRGEYTYMVQPIGCQHDNGYSLAHGAGRKWQRSVAKANIQKRYSIQDLCRTPLGGRVICEDKDLIYEEAPNAYKDIETVIQCLLDRKIIQLIARFKPIITYKTSRSCYE